MSYTITRSARDEEGGSFEGVAKTPLEALKMARNAPVLGMDLVEVTDEEGHRYTLAEFTTAYKTGKFR
ncbi:MAG: hypothetical protein KIT43_02760 [Bauldia sp.]|nr:hypothetical protein [Bauldia sp.]MCW5719232.1 hypothetical protein [Bauldia sp.]